MPMLPVPYIGQWGITANHYRSDCGVASIAMCLEYYGIRGNLTVDQLATETPLSQSDGGLWPVNLVSLAGRHGLTACVHDNTTLDDLWREVDALRPVVVLVAYRYISGRLDQADNKPGSDGHYMVILGYDDNHFVANDPDYWGGYTEQGHDVLIPISELDTAMSVYNGQTIMMEQPMAIQDQIVVLANQNAANDAQIAALAAQISSTPAPIPGITMYATDTVNMRTEPSAAQGTATVKGTLKKGDTVQVEDAVVNGTVVAGWKKIVYGTFSGYYVSATYLSLTRP
jgi:uncharacterized protein YvpB